MVLLEPSESHGTCLRGAEVVKAMPLPEAWYRHRAGRRRRNIQNGAFFSHSNLLVLLWRSRLDVRG